MSPLMQEILNAKAKERKRLASLPIHEKLEIMERLRDFAVFMRRHREKRQAMEFYLRPTIQLK